MRPHLKTFLVVAFALAAASPFAQDSLAQTAPNGGGANGGATVNAGGSVDATGAGGTVNPNTSGQANGAPNGQVGFQRRQTLSVQEEVLEGDRTIARMETAAALIRGQLGKARAERDVVKTLCLNDKLSQADVAVRTGRDRNAALKDAAGRNDAELANHEFTILSVLGQRSQQLTAEANQCIGEEAAFIGETRVETNIDTTLPPPDETEIPVYDVPINDQPPQCTTCSI